MKELINAVRAELAGSLNYVQEADIFVTPNENYLPERARFPCIGVKDGAIVRTELVGGMMNYSMTLRLVLWVALLKDEGSIMGDDATGQKGVLEFANDVLAILDENLLDIAGMTLAISPDDSASELFGDEQEAMQRKIINMQYEKEAARP